MSVVEEKGNSLIVEAGKIRATPSSVLYTHLFQPISPLLEESEECNNGAEGVQEEEINAEVRGPPDYLLQKEEITPLLSQKLRKGDEWYVFIGESGCLQRLPL